MAVNEYFVVAVCDFRGMVFANRPSWIRTSSVLETSHRIFFILMLEVDVNFIIFNDLRKASTMALELSYQYKVKSLKNIF